MIHPNTTQYRIPAEFGDSQGVSVSRSFVDRDMESLAICLVATLFFYCSYTSVEPPTAYEGLHITRFWEGSCILIHGRCPMLAKFFSLGFDRDVSHGSRGHREIMG